MLQKDGDIARLLQCIKEVKYLTQTDNNRNGLDIYIIQFQLEVN